ncbi:MAG: hypothetical protein ACK5Q5_07540 [Planctomycetaceae bacterium]
MVQVQVDGVWIVDFHADPAANDFSTFGHLELKRASLGEHTLKFAEQLRFGLVEVVLTQPIKTFPNLSEVVKAETALSNHEGADSFIRRQYIDKAPNCLNRSWTDSLNNICQLIVGALSAALEKASGDV